MCVALLVAPAFGFFHGYAHGAETLLRSGSVGFSLGFLATSAGLHVIGVIVSLLFQHEPRPTRYFALTGSLITIAGSSMAIRALFAGA